MLVQVSKAALSSIDVTSSSPVKALPLFVRLLAHVLFLQMEVLELLQSCFLCVTRLSNDVIPDEAHMTGSGVLSLE